MNETGPRWDEVGRRFDNLANKLKLHYEQNAGEVDRAELDTALRKFGDALDQGLRSVADAARDPSVREGADQLATSLGDALSQTFSQVGEQVRAAFTQRRDGGHSDQLDD